MATNHLHEIEALGQSIWLDNISRELLDEGKLRSLVEDDGITGVTSNPTIFEKAMGQGDRYDQGLEREASEGHDAREVFFNLAIQDIRDGADLLRPIWERTGGQDGYISFELPPELGDDVEGSVEAAKRFRSQIDRPNVFIKVPATEAGVKAFEELTAAGVSINVTLLFAVSRYEAIAEAYVRGLERRAADGEPIDRIASVASFFVSRVDTKVDEQLKQKGRSDLGGKAAVANAKVAYQSFLRIFSGTRWEALKAKGANVQRPLWASTSTKNPDYPDTLYVDNLIGPDTVNTMPDATIDASRDHAHAARTIDHGVDEARALLAELRGLGIDLDDITERILVDEGMASFAKSFDSLIDTIAGKVAALRGGEYAGAAGDARREGLLAVAELDAIRRLFDRDASLWPGGQGAHWLGWLDAIDEQRRVVHSLERYADETAPRFDAIVVCGMGGSSLAPLVLAEVFGASKLHVLDSTDPHAVRGVPSENTLFVISSKSGSTIEPGCFAEHFWSLTENDRTRFVAITDPDSPLHHEAEDRRWPTVFRGRPDVGGRYSALTPFGLVPAALGGVPVRALLDDADTMLAACGPDVPLEDNPAAGLAAALAESARSGRDKLTILTSHGFDSLGLWLEQLVAESTGKQGLGIVPVAGEPIGAPESYGDDRLFVYLRHDASHDAFVEPLRAAGLPIVTLPLPRRESIGGELVRWEIAIALAGALLGLDPFDQPNVQEAKDATAALLRDYEDTHQLPEADPGSLDEVLAACLAGRSYLCLQAFVAPSPAVAGRLHALQGRLRDALGVAVTAGFGPRYLHSTGQLHKGGPPTGCFVQLLHDLEHDLAIPGRPYGFLTLRDAQALGDALALRERGRPVARLSFADLDEVDEAIDAALARLAPRDGRPPAEGEQTEMITTGRGS